MSRVLLRSVAPLAQRSLVPAARTFATQSSLKPRPTATALVAAGSAAVAASLLFASLPSQAAPAQVDAAAVKAAILKVMEDEDNRRGDGTSIGPTFVRLAWHCAGTYSKHDGSGGSNGGRMRFHPECAWGANAGLSTARNFLDPIKTNFPGLSSADLYTFAGVVAVEAMGGPAVPFAFGRSDTTDGATSPPDDMGSDVATAQHLRDIFYRMGFDDREIVALSGAHALGRCHEDASGYWGPWTNAETTFSNEYFRLLKDEKWTLKTKKHEAGGCPWKGPAQFESKDGTLMMLPSDIVLTKDPAFSAWVDKYTADEALFFADFASAFGKLLALGCPGSAGKAAATAGGGAGGGGIVGTIKGIVGL